MAYNITDKQKLDTSILIRNEMEDGYENKIAAGISKTWLSNQWKIQEAIIRDYRAKVEAEQVNG